MKFLQINTNRCRRAHDLLYQANLEWDIDLCLVSEPNAAISAGWGGCESEKIWRTSKNTYVDGMDQGTGYTWVKIQDILIISV